MFFRIVCLLLKKKKFFKKTSPLNLYRFELNKKKFLQKSYPDDDSLHHNKLKIFLKNFLTPNLEILPDERDAGVVSLRYKLSNIRKIPNEIKLQFKSERHRFIFNTIKFKKATNLIGDFGHSKAGRFVFSLLRPKQFKFKKNFT